MKAAVLHAEGEFPRCEIVPDPPAPGKGQLLVKVAAAGLNYADTMMRRGFYVQNPKFPHRPGLEFAGIVEAVGPDTPGWRPGDRVMGLGMGCFAELLTVDARAVMPVPAKFSFEEAAGFPLVFLTAYPMLTLMAHAQPGETVLIHAAGGGVGTAAVQLARHIGLRVIACASSDDKLERVRGLGADFTINYSRDDFAPLVRQYTNGRGADIVLESIGGDVIPRSIQAMAPFGRMVIFGFASGQRQTINPSDLFQNSLTVSAFWLVTLAGQPDLFQKVVRELLQIVETSDIRPIISATYSIEDAGEAMQALESRRTYGKLLIRP